MGRQGAINKCHYAASTSQRKLDKVSALPYIPLASPVLWATGHLLCPSSHCGTNFAWVLTTVTWAQPDSSSPHICPAYLSPLGLQISCPCEAWDVADLFGTQVNAMSKCEDVSNPQREAWANRRQELEDKCFRLSPCMNRLSWAASSYDLLEDNLLRSNN